jgi:hypothetical protein
MTNRADNLGEDAWSISDDRLETALVRRLNQVNDWLKFAEAKNGLVLALGLAGLAAIASILSSDRDLYGPAVWAMSSGFVVFSVVALLALASFIPRTDLPGILKASLGEVEPGSNLDFYGDLRNFTSEELSDTLSTHYRMSGLKRKIHKDLAAQIIVNSQIAWDKFRIFTWSVKTLYYGMLLIGVVTAVAALIGD